MQAIRRRIWYLVMGMCWVSLSQAADQVETPSLELLEYLGMMVEEDDGYIGPEDLDEEPEPFPDSILVSDDAFSEEEGTYRD